MGVTTLDTAIINYLFKVGKSTSKRFCRSSIMESYVTTLVGAPFNVTYPE